MFSPRLRQAGPAVGHFFWRCGLCFHVVGRRAQEGGSAGSLSLFSHCRGARRWENESDVASICFDF